jgi:hypothetical protein
MIGRILAGGCHDQAAVVGGDPSRASGSACVLEAGQTLMKEPAPPLADRVPGQPQAVSSFLQRSSLSALEHDEGAVDNALTAGRTADDGLQLLALLLREHEGREMHCGSSS